MNLINFVTKWLW